MIGVLSVGGPEEMRVKRETERAKVLKRWRMQGVRKALPKMSRTNLVMIFANRQYLQTRPWTHTI